MFFILFPYSQSKRCSEALSQLESTQTEISTLQNQIKEEEEQHTVEQQALLTKLKEEMAKSEEKEEESEKNKRECEILQQDKARLRRLLEAEHSKVVQLQRSLNEITESNNNNYNNNNNTLISTNNNNNNTTLFPSSQLSATSPQASLHSPQREINSTLANPLNMQNIQNIQNTPQISSPFASPLHSSDMMVSTYRSMHPQIENEKSIENTGNMNGTNSLQGLFQTPQMRNSNAGE